MSADEMAPGEIVRTLARLDDGQKELVRAQREGQKAVMDTLTLMRGEFIHRTEFDLQNRIVTNDLADHENAARDDRLAHEALVEQVSILKQHSSRLSGIIAAMGVILSVVVAVITSYIQSGRLW